LALFQEASVFDEVLGLPAHPLLVHAAVVFVPLLVAAGVAYAVLPFTRRWIAWAVIGLAVVAPLSAWFATLSGNAFRNDLASQGIAPELLAQIDEHRGFGDRTLWAAIALAVLSVLLVAAQRMGARSSKLWVTVLLSVGVIGLSAVSLYYVFKAGDSGARAVWGS
jgi:hypothetical protein